ncbi:MAG: rRNA maturation RNase YbeY [Candidatus Berkelbacteria bacterium]|nr:rRNA maturation RNase YbeY [Candidatus Berkelbacteria bacterium]
MNLILIKSIKNFSLGLKSVEKTALKILKKKNVTNSILEIEIVGRKKIQSLNHKFQKKNCPTDVLSFPLSRDQQNGDQPRLLGNIFLYSDIIKKNARQSNKSFEEEFEFILAHGINHLLGVHHK